MGPLEWTPGFAGSGGALRISALQGAATPPTLSKHRFSGSRVSHLLRKAQASRFKSRMGLHRMALRGMCLPSGQGSHVEGSVASGLKQPGFHPAQPSPALDFRGSSGKPAEAEWEGEPSPTDLFPRLAKIRVFSLPRCFCQPHLGPT